MGFFAESLPPPPAPPPGMARGRGGGRGRGRGEATPPEGEAKKPARVYSRKFIVCLFCEQEARAACCTPHTLTTCIQALARTPQALAHGHHKHSRTHIRLKRRPTASFARTAQLTSTAWKSRSRQRTKKPTQLCARTKTESRGGLLAGIGSSVSALRKAAAFRERVNSIGRKASKSGSRAGRTVQESGGAS